MLVGISLDMGDSDQITVEAVAGCSPDFRVLITLNVKSAEWGDVESLRYVGLGEFWMLFPRGRDFARALCGNPRSLR